MSENKISLGLDLDNNLIQDFSPKEESTIAGGMSYCQCKRLQKQGYRIGCGAFKKGGVKSVR